MAGVEESVTQAAGSLQGLARAQAKALAAMRWRVFRNSLRSTEGAAELGASIVAHLVYSLLGVGLAFGLGGGAYAVVANGKWAVMPVLFWGLLLLWQVVPVTVASFQEQFDPGGLLRFPVSFGTYFLLHLIFGLVDISTILGILCCLGMWVGTVVARPELAGWMAAALLGFGAFNVLLVRAMLSWIDRWMAQRRTREIVSAVFILLLLSLQLLNPAFHMNKGTISKGWQEGMMRRLGVAQHVQKWLPPGVAGLVIEDAVGNHPRKSLEALAGLGIYALGAGVVLGRRLHAGYRGENLSDAPARANKEARQRTAVAGGSGPVAAVMVKELRTLRRSTPLIYGIVAPLFMVFVLAGLFVRHGGAAPSLALMLSSAYAFVGFIQLFFNTLGVEGAAVQLLFLSPTPMRTVMLAKNLVHAGLLAVDAVLVWIAMSLRIGWPRPEALAATTAWLLFALPIQLAAGNLLSLLMPYRINLGRLAKQKGSQLSALVSMGIQAAVLGVGVGVCTLCEYAYSLWAAVPVFVVLAAAAVLAWLRVLDKVDTMAAVRREALMSVLVRAD